MYVGSRAVVCVHMGTHTHTDTHTHTLKSRYVCIRMYIHTSVKTLAGVHILHPYLFSVLSSSPSLPSSTFLPHSSGTHRTVVLPLFTKICTRSLEEKDSLLPTIARLFGQAMHSLKSECVFILTPPFDSTPYPTPLPTP